MSGNTKKVLKLLILGTLGVALAAYYFAGYVQTLIYLHNFSINPVTIIKVSIEYGFPTLLFCVIFLPLLFVIILVTSRYAKSLSKVDVLGRKFDQPTETMSYGDAHFMEPWEYKDKARVGPIGIVTGPILGQTMDSNKGERCIAKKPGNPNDNMLIVAPSGSGKSATFARNAAYQTIKERKSIVITDPKGELHADLAGLFTTHGYVVRTLNLIDFDASNTWNIMSGIIDEKLVESVSILVDTMVKNFKGDGERVKNDIYTNGEKLLLQAFMLRVYLGTDYGPDEKNIRSVHELAISDDLEMKMLDQSCASTPREYNLWHSPWQKIKAGATGNLWGNILTNLLADLGILGDDKVCTLISDDDIDMHLPGIQPCAYFLIIPAHHETYRFISALFFTSFFQTLIDDASHMPGITLPVCVNFLLDEFANIGVIPGWPGTISVTRSFNINAWMIVQTIGQLETNYENSWETIMSNCAVHLILGANEETTCKYFSGQIGNTTIRTETEQHKQNEFFFLGMRRKSTREDSRPLLDVSELRTLPQYHCVILLSGKQPILAKTVYHELHPLSKERCEDPLGPMPPLSDGPGRTMRMLKEADILDAYYEAHKDERPMTDEELDALLEPPSPAETVKSKAKAFFSNIRNSIPKAEPEALDDVDFELGEIIDLDELDALADETSGSQNNGNTPINDSLSLTPEPIEDVHIERSEKGAGEESTGADPELSEKSEKKRPVKGRGEASLERANKGVSGEGPEEKKDQLPAEEISHREKFKSEFSAKKDITKSQSSQSTPTQSAPTQSSQSLESKSTPTTSPQPNSNTKATPPRPIQPVQKTTTEVRGQQSGQSMRSKANAESQDKENANNSSSSPFTTTEKPATITMTLAEAHAFTIPGNGKFGGKTMGDLAAASTISNLRWFAKNYTGQNTNDVRTAAQIVYNDFMKRSKADVESQTPSSSAQNTSTSTVVNQAPRVSFSSVRSYQDIRLSGDTMLKAEGLNMIAPDRGVKVSEEASFELP